MSTTANPLVAPAYTAGTITITGGVVTNLLAAIQAQLEPNQSGAALGITLTADQSNAGIVYVGAASTLGGPLTSTNYGYSLNPTGSSYRNTPGAGFSAPVGQIQLLSPSNATLHVEIY